MQNGAVLLLRCSTIGLTLCSALCCFTVGARDELWGGRTTRVALLLNVNGVVPLLWDAQVLFAQLFESVWLYYWVQRPALLQFMLLHGCCNIGSSCLVWNVQTVRKK